VRVGEDGRGEDQVLFADGRRQVDAELIADADEVALLSAVRVDGIAGVLEAGVEGGDGLASSFPICRLWTTETERSICVSVG
jgi:hypothetical protein